MNRARRLDRQVYLRSHPLLFALLAATRHRPVVRFGRTVLVHQPEAYRQVLTRVPLDRAAPGTTGGAARELTGGEVLFDQEGEAHRYGRRRAAERLGAQGVARLRPGWQALLREEFAELRPGTDLVPVAQRLAGATAAALTGSSADPLLLARAAGAAAAAAVRDHLPGPIRRAGGAGTAAGAAGRLAELLPDPRDAMLAVAAVNTTVAALPRTAAWCARAGLWHRVTPDPGSATSTELTAELLRLTAPTPILPRVAAADALVTGHRIHRGDRLILVTRHAARAHLDSPDDPAAARAVFGAGPHACPGRRLAETQLTDFLAALAPHRPRVLRARVDRGAALPGYAELLVRPGRTDGRRP